MKTRISVILMLVLLMVTSLSLSCKKNGSTEEEIQTTAVGHGNISLEVSASGNLALSKTEDMAFEVEGYVYRVLVEEGDHVSEGDLLAEASESDWEEKRDSLERALISAKVSVNSAQISLEDAKSSFSGTSVTSGTSSAPDPLEIESKELQLESAKLSLASAQKEYDEFLETSYQVIAPFDGFITTVHVEGGDEIYKGSLACSIADPSQFEADIYVSEMDIYDIQIGMPATVELMSYSGVSFPAEVTRIAPTATNQSGVVSYAVKVELREPDTTQQSGNVPQTGQMPAWQNRQRPSSTPDSPSASGERVFPGHMQMPEGAQPPFAVEQEQWALSDLKEGLTVTITIVTEEATDVLLVPASAITTRGNMSSVQVLKGDTVEMRRVTTGISDYQNTEIKDGLSEGELVVTGTTSKATSTTTNSSQQRNGGSSRGMFGPGMLR